MQFIADRFCHFGHMNSSVATCTLFAIGPLLGMLGTNEPQHEISNNVVCATSKGSDQPAYMRSLIRAFASQLHIL